MPHAPPAANCGALPVALVYNSRAMIKNAEYLREWEKAQGREPVDIARNRRLFEGLYRLARNLGALGPEEDSLDHKIALARALNVRVAAREPR